MFIVDTWDWSKVKPTEEEPDEGYLINITIDDMISEMLECIRNGTCYHTYYLKNEDSYSEIVECDLFRGRVVAADGDYSEFDWEMEEDSHIYREAI